MKDSREFAKQIFLENIYRTDSAGSFLSKDEIINFAKKYEIDFKPREAKKTIINKIIDSNNLDKLFNENIDRFTIPVWKVADFYGLNSDDIESLRALGIIKEEPIKDSFYSRLNRNVVEYNAYPVSVLSYDKDFLTDQFNLAFNFNGVKVRIETKNKNDIAPIIDLLRKVAIVNEPDSYEHRNKNGYYHYLYLKMLNNSEIQSNKLLLDIEKLKKENECLRDFHRNEIKRINDKWLKLYGVEHYVEAKNLVLERDYYKEQYEKLLEETNNN